MLSLMSILFFCHWNSSSRTAAKQHEKLVTPWFGLVFLGLARFCLLVDINNNDNYNKDHIKERPGAEHVLLQLWLLLLLLLLLSSYKKWKNTKNVYKIKLNSLLLYFKFKIFISMSSTWLVTWMLWTTRLLWCCPSICFPSLLPNSAEATKSFVRPNDMPQPNSNSSSNINMSAIHHGRP